MGGNKGKEFVEDSENFGGTDKNDWRKYMSNDETASFDKPDHFERSASHQPNHFRFLQKLLRDRRDADDTNP